MENLCSEASNLRQISELREKSISHDRYGGDVRPSTEMNRHGYQSRSPSKRDSRNSTRIISSKDSFDGKLARSHRSEFDRRVWSNAPTEFNQRKAWQWDEPLLQQPMESDGWVQEVSNAVRQEQENIRLLELLVDQRLSWWLSVSVATTRDGSIAARSCDSLWPTRFIRSIMNRPTKTFSAVLIQANFMPWVMNRRQQDWRAPDNRCSSRHVSNHRQWIRFSHAWILQGIILALSTNSKQWHQLWQLDGSHNEGSHWLGTFAVYPIARRAINTVEIDDSKWQTLSSVSCEKSVVRLSVLNRIKCAWLLVYLSRGVSLVSPTPLHDHERDELGVREEAQCSLSHILVCVYDAVAPYSAMGTCRSIVSVLESLVNSCASLLSPALYSMGSFENTKIGSFLRKCDVW